MEYQIPLGEGTPLRVSEPRVQTEHGRVWDVGADVTVASVDLAACRLFDAASR